MQELDYTSSTAIKPVYRHKQRRDTMQKIAKKITAVMLAVAMMIGSTASVMAAEPIREAFEAAGGVVTWEHSDQLIIIEIAESVIVLAPGSNIAQVNGVTFELSNPVTLENGVSFMEMEDLMALSLALMGVVPTTDEHGMAVATANALAAQFMELASVPDFSLAIVNVNTGFIWTDTMGAATDADTIFHLGSIAKTFTAVAVMQLVEQGLLDLDTPIVRYLPEFSVLPSASGEGNYRNITARMLLSHTSGIYTNDMGSGFVTYGGHNENYMNNFLARFASTRMVRQEGTAFEYANTGFVILGILVAHIAGHDNYFQGFNQHMLENVFEPMGLTRTSYVVTPELSPYVAPVYTMAGMPQQFQYWNPLPTGTMFSTANEMVSLMSMFLNNGSYNGNQILTPQSVNAMFTDQTGAGHYGLGIAFMQDPSGSGYVMEGHNGGMIYNFAAMFLDRQHGIGVFSASNSTSSSGLNEALAGSVIATAVTEVGGEITPISHLDPAATPVERPVEELEALTGLYVIAGGMTHLFVELVDGQLSLRIPAQGLELALIPMSDGHFATEIGVPFWLIQDGDDILFVQGANRNTVAGARVDPARFMPDEDFMENWYGYTFIAFQEDESYVMFIPSTVFGVNEDGLAFSTSVIINMPPGMALTILEPMDTDIVLQYEDGEYFFVYWGIRFVRQ